MKVIFKLFSALLLTTVFYNAKAQAPSISYTTPQTLYVGKPASNISPVNTGGGVPMGYNPHYIYFTTPGFFNESGSLIASSAGIYNFFDNRLYRSTNTGGSVAIAGGNKIDTLDGKGASAGFRQPDQMVMDAKGNIFVADNNYLDPLNCKIRKVTPAGVVTTLAKNLTGLGAMAIAPNGTIYCYTTDGILKVTTAGAVSVLQKNFPVNSGEMPEVNTMAVDKAGNIFIADNLSRSILKVTPAGAVSIFAGSGYGDVDGIGTAAKLGGVGMMAFDSKDVLWFNDVDNGKFKKITPDGTVSTVAEGAIYDENNQNSYTGFYFNFSIDKQDNVFFFSGTHINILQLNGYSIKGDLPEGLKLDTDGKITGTPTKLTAATDVFITATNASGKSTAKVTIEVVAPTDPPVITSFAPAAVAAGYEFRINGSFFLNTSAVSIGGKPATEFHLESSTVVWARVPEGATSGQVSVTTPHGTATLAGLVVIQPPVIGSLSAMSGKAGDKIIITGNNLSTTRTVYVGAYVNEYRVISDTELEVTLGQWGASGDITLYTSAGSAKYSGFIYIYPPTISAITPTSAGGGTTVTITGTNFYDVTAVKFGVTAAASFAVESPTTIKAVVAAGSNGQITVVTAAGTISAGNFTYISPPIITGVAPLKAGVGSTVNILGSNLLNAQVTVANVPATIIFNGLSQIVITVPAGVASGEIKVTTPSGSVTSAGFTLVPPPQIASFSPTTAGAGDHVLINGQNFTDATLVTIGGVSTPFTVVSPTVIDAVVGQAASGNITVRSPGGEVSLGGFSYKGAAITAFAPVSAGNGETVTITGSNFNGATKVTFGGVDAKSFTIVSATEIKAVVGTGTSGFVGVTTGFGSGYLAGFSHPGPSITSFSPTYSGPLSTTPIIITGKNFTGATSVSFGGVEAASFSVVSATTISAIPANSPTGDVEVNTPAGTFKRSGFTWVQPPVISSFTPTGQKLNGTVTITGNNFIGLTSVKFGGVNAAGFFSNSASSITAYVGNGASGDVTVSTIGGTVSLSGFTFTSPAITSIIPAAAGAGQTVTITGNNLSDVQQVRFGGINAASFTIVSATEIKAVLGAGALGNVTVTGPNSGTASFSAFSYVYPAQLYSVEPKQGGTGTEITINGYNLAEATEVTIGGTPVNIVSKTQNIIKVKALSGVSGTINVKTPVSNLSIEKFEWFPAPTITSISPVTSNNVDTIIVNGTNLTNVTSVGFGGAAPFSYYKVVSPSQLKVVNINSGTGSITVVTIGGSATIGGYTFIPPPVITSFSVANGGAGAVVTITGKDFNNVNEVSFGGVPAQLFTVVSSNQITASPGAGANGEIVVKTRGGTAKLPGYLYNMPPYITSFFPTGGSKGTLVTIMGKHFNSNASSNTVFFGSVKGEVKSVSAEKMEVIAPAGAGGLLMVVNTETNLSAYSNLPFNIKKAYTDAVPFPKKHEVAFGSQINHYEVADFDNDGKLDVFAATNDSLIVLQNSGGSLASSVFGKRFSVERLRTVNSVVTGDVDGDGRIDILIGQEPSVVLLRNTTVNNNITFEVKVFENMRSEGGVARLRDLDLDGRPDISGGYQFQNITKNGVVDFGPLFYLSTSTSNNVYSSQFTDIDGDGRPDAVYGNSNYYHRGIVWQNKTVPGVLTSNDFTYDYMNGSDTQGFHGDQVYLADIDGDGKVDVMQKSNYVYGEFYLVALNKSIVGTVNKDSFKPFVRVLERGEVLGITDVNGDNKPDVVYQRYNDGLYVAINNSTIGNVVFAEPVKLISANPEQYFLNLTVRDVDGNGRNDLLVIDNNGKLLIYHNSTGLKPSLLKFPPIAAYKYGDADFNLGATTDNNRVPLTYVVDKPEIATVEDGVVHILKSGTVLIGVTQANDYEYDGLTIQQTLVIKKAPLTLIPDNITRKANEPNPLLVGTAKGFVNNENTNNLIKVPVWTTTATDNSLPGVYDIVGSGGEAENYDFVYQTGKLTILQVKPLITFPPITTHRYGDTDIDLGTTSTNRDVAITYTVDDPGVATVINNKLHILKAGTVQITAAQEGNIMFERAENVQQTAVIEKAPLTITADDKTRIAGKADPVFTVTYNGLVNSETHTVLTQQPVATTTATATSSAGVYDIVAGGALSENYSFTYNNGKLTITPALDNLRISATDVTCKGQGNGMIAITAKQTASYTAVLTGNSLNKSYTFTTNLNIENLLPGAYKVCVADVALPGQSQCFDLTIAEPKDLSVYTSVKQNTSLLNVALSGGSQYSVTLNGVMYSTRNSSITLELNRGSNKLEVTTDKECQGKVDKIINYSGNPVPYPNPFSNELYVNVGIDAVNAAIKIYSVTDGLIKLAEQFKNVNGVIKLDVSKLKMGIYSVHVVKGDSESVYKVIKQ